MRRRELIAGIGSCAAWPRISFAQQPNGTRRIGVLMAVSDSDPDVQAGLKVFRDRLRELGWEEGRNVRLDYRWGDAKAERITGFASELVRLSPDILVAHSTPPTAALARETHQIPIVFLTVTDPVGQGLVASLARPGGNVTGFSVFEASLGAKWLQLLNEIAPDIRRAYIVFNPVTAPYYELYLRVIADQAASFTIEPIPVQVHDRAEIGQAIANAASQAGSGLFVLPDSSNVVHRDLIIQLAAQYRLPAIYYFRYFAKDGGLISYGPDELDLFRRTAGYVDRILRGSAPAGLPVQVPSKWEMAVNLKTARALGLTVPQPLLVQADEVIE
jgi:putative ABC transport system substrate-binding protein